MFRALISIGSRSRIQPKSCYLNVYIMPGVQPVLSAKTNGASKRHSTNKQWEPRKKHKQNKPIKSEGTHEEVLFKDITALLGITTLNDPNVSSAEPAPASPPAPEFSRKSKSQSHRSHQQAMASAPVLRIQTASSSSPSLPLAMSWSPKPFAPLLLPHIQSPTFYGYSRLQSTAPLRRAAVTSLHAPVANSKCCLTSINWRTSAG